jgi:cysteine sulfinate desulfinase/cysteine desulfurase-like protein
MVLQYAECFAAIQKINSNDFISSDMKGIAVPEGACQSGSIKASHVLAEMLSHADLKKTKSAHFV